MKKILLFVLTLACFASFAGESRLERCLRIINERFTEEQETVEYIEAKKELVNSKEGFAIIPSIVITKTYITICCQNGMSSNKMASQKNLWLPKNKSGDK